MARQWGIREPNSYEMVCQNCGKTFHTRMPGKQKYCGEVCVKAVHQAAVEKHNRSEYKRRKMTPHAGQGMFRFEWDSDDYDDHARVDQLGLDDGTEDVGVLLGRGIVWAHHAGYPDRMIPFQYAIMRLWAAAERAYEKELRRREKAEARLREQWEEELARRQATTAA